MEAPDDALKFGVLLKKETKGKNFQWKEYYFVLSGQILYWFKTVKEAKNKKKAKGSVTLPTAAIREPPNLSPPETQPYTFQLVVDGGVMSLCCASEIELADWLDVLKSAQSGINDLNKETVQIREQLRKAGHDIPPEDLDFDDSIIGSGASGVVKRGLWLKSTEVAVKALKNLPEFTDQKELILFYKEIETLSKLRHINIVQMYGFCKKGNFLCLVTEFVRGGNLAECLSNPDKYPMDLRLQIELALTICRGMVYLHSVNVIHRDLKPANILIENWDEAKAKVCDFGLSKVVKKQDVQMTADALGSPQYAAPELNTDSHSNKVDVFSFGIILWELCTRESPWPELKFGWQFAERYQKNERPAPPNHPLRDLVTKCWHQNPNERPTFGQVYEEIEKVKTQLFGSSPLVRSGSMRQTSSNNLPQYSTAPSRPRVEVSEGFYHTEATVTSSPHSRTLPKGKAPVPAQPTPKPPQTPLESFYMQPTPSPVKPSTPPESFYMSNKPTTSATTTKPAVQQSPTTNPNGSNYMSHQAAQLAKIASNPHPTTAPTFKPATSNTGYINIPANRPPPSPPTESPYMNVAANGQPRPVPNIRSPTQSPSPQHHRSLPAQQTPRPAGGVLEERFARLFGTKQKETWLNFSALLRSVLFADDRHISTLKYLFDDGGYVDKSIWDHFLLWFSPLSTNKESYEGFDIDTICELVDPSWFHGFLSSTDSQVKLRGYRDGTWLLRFSTTSPGWYSLSVAYSGTAGHWRIQGVKEVGQPLKFVFDEKVFSSLAEIKDNYSQYGRSEPLKIKNPKPDQPPTILLGDPFHRAEQYYQNIH